MMAVSGFHEFKTRDDLAEQLSQDIHDRLLPDLEEMVFASVALSGGSTPGKMLERLGSKLGELGEMVYFAMVDERYVPIDDTRSNEAMIKAALGLTNHPETEFLSLHQTGLDVEQAAQRANAQLHEDDELPFDVVTLGLGTDGHTASFFPGAPNLDQLVSDNAEGPYLATIAPLQQEARLTLTLPYIVSAGFLVLHIEGDEKRTVFEQALQDGPAEEMPIRHALRHPHAHVQVYWAP